MAGYVKINDLNKVSSASKSDTIILEKSTGTNAITCENLFKSEELKSAAVTGNAGTHNGIFRGKDLTHVYNIEEICKRINAGTFDDLFIGDYFDVTISTSYTTSEVVRCIIAGFDMYYMNGDISLTKHHAVIVPKNCFTATHKMYETGTITGGYFGSDIHTTVLPVYAEALKKTALNNHIIKYKDLLTTGISNTGTSMAGAGYVGYSNKWEWKETELRLMSEVQVYGCTVLSSSFYDVGCANLQLPLFRLDPRSKIAGLGGIADNRAWCWLSSVASGTLFALVHGGGHSSYGGVSLAHGVRPLFLIGNP